MFARLIQTRPSMLAMTMLLPLAVACSDNDPIAPDPITHVGRWQVTSFQADGVEVLEPDTSTEISFAASGTYSAVTRENGIVCDVCFTTGTYVATSTSITFNPGSDDEELVHFVIQGAVMTMKGQDEWFGEIVLVLRRL